MNGLNLFSKQNLFYHKINISYALVELILFLFVQSSRFAENEIIYDMKNNYNW